jgi:hypothetical protein
MSHFILASRLTRLSGYNMSRMRRVAISDPITCYPTGETISDGVFAKEMTAMMSWITKHLSALYTYTCDFMKSCT